ncbi:MAG: glycosyltransferase family 39 protein [Candidatus Lindowbacteria bacterium]|nr:glycosyltransferase family 39 protein [Candidatus Lindowbacteria bacterium]
MSGKIKTSLFLIATTAYCLLSWIAMRNDYFTVGAELSTNQQLVHLSITAAGVLIITLVKSPRIEAFIQRISSLPLKEWASTCAAAAIIAVTLLNYPRNKISLQMLTWGLMESTRAFVEDMFLAGAAVGLVSLIVINAPVIAEKAHRVAEKLLFQSPRYLFLSTAILIVFLVTNAISLYQFHHVPICSDEVCYIFQSKIFASGQLYAKPPRYPEFFQFVSFISNSGKWYSIVAPGYPLLLTLGLFVGATWIVNPTLAALCVLLVYLTAARIYDERIARGAASLTVVSPFFLMLSSVHLSHIAAAFFFLLFLYLFLRSLSGNHPLICFLGGVSLGAMVLTRPLTGLAASVPWGAYTLWLLYKRRVPFTNALWLALGLTVPFIPAIALSAIPFALPSRNKWDYLLLAHLLAIPAVHFFFFHQDFFFGPRYYFCITPAALILAARGLREAPVVWKRFSGSVEDRMVGSRFLTVLVLVCAAFGLAVFLPEKLGEYNLSSPIHQGVPAPIWRHVDSGKINNAVIFISNFPSTLAYGTGLWRNDPDLEGEIVYALDRGPANMRLMEQYAGRKFYRYMPITDSFEEILPPTHSIAAPALSP